MTSRDTQRPPAIDAKLLERFKDDVEDRYGKLRGNYSSELEAALREYLDRSEGKDVHYRLEQIEDDLSEIKDSLSDDGAKKKKETGDTTTSTTEKRLRQINATIEEESGGQPQVHNEVVEMAIRQHAGSSDPTVRRYKKLLQQDNMLFEHPVEDNRYFRSSEDFTKAVNALAKGSKLSGKKYQKIVDNYGEEWWREQLADDTDRAERTGFQ